MFCNKSPNIHLLWVQKRLLTVVQLRDETVTFSRNESALVFNDLSSFFYRVSRVLFLSLRDVLLKLVELIFSHEGQSFSLSRFYSRLSVLCHQAALRSHVSTNQPELIPSWPLLLEQRARCSEITWIVQTTLNSIC